VFDTNQLVSISSDVIILFFAIGIFFSVITFIISYVASKRLTDPILQLKASMKQFEKGDFDAKANITVNNEVAELGDSFNNMTVQIKNLVAQELLIEEQKRISELQALQAQIRPHFLYNTLESIIWMSEIGENEKVIEMTSSLSKLFRATTSNASELVTLKTEIDYVTNYMKIQKMRYQDKLNYRIEVDDSILEAKVIKLIIQPMVENAIYHGIKQLKGQGLIIVSAHAQGQKLLISISDNGIGFEKGILDGTVDFAPKDESGIGISNVRDRIKLFFGTDYGITILSTAQDEASPRKDGEPEMRTTVTLTLPLIFE
jgi:two-component system sensor histidine kinase YesM